MKRLDQYLQIKKDPAFATLLYLEQLKSVANEIVMKAFEQKTQEIINKFVKERDEAIKAVKKEINPLIKEAVNSVKEYVYEHPELFKGEKGESIKGEDGKVPTIEELTEIIKSQIPPPEKGEDGKTPIEGLDYPSERQIKEMIENMFSTITVDYKKTVNELLPKLKIPTFDEIARGIESLPEQKKLDYRTGLKNTPNETSSNTNNTTFRSGGMGNVETQSTNLSSATTTINLVHNIASNGKAIWFNYQGQQQQLGVHFTVSGKIITLLFTPDDNTVADIIYIRK